MQNISVSQSFDKRKQNSGHSPDRCEDACRVWIDPCEWGSESSNGVFEIEKIPFSKEQEIHVICQSGGRSMKVSQKLEAAGFTKIVNVEGGNFSMACGRITGG
jgi:rhodanese-related sulfurtransferase